MDEDSQELREGSLRPESNNKKLFIFLFLICLCAGLWILKENIEINPPAPKVENPLGQSDTCLDVKSPGRYCIKCNDGGGICSDINSPGRYCAKVVSPNSLLVGSVIWPGVTSCKWTSVSGGKQ